MTFGSTLRAFRLGYHVSQKHNALVKVSDYPDGKKVSIKLVPIDGKVPHDKFKDHRCWWERDGELLDAVPALRGIRNVKRIISFDVDAETGELT